MAVHLVSKIATMDVLNHDCMRAILPYIHVEERMKFREVSEKFRDAADASWGEVKEVYIAYDVPSKECKLNSDRESSKGESKNETNHRKKRLSGTHHVVRIETSEQKLIKEVLKRCGNSIRILVEKRHKEAYSVLPFAIEYCPAIERLTTTVNTEEDDINMRRLLANMKKLKSLELKIIFENTEQCFREITTDNLEKLVFTTWLCSNPSNEIINGQKGVLGRCSSSMLKHFSTTYLDDEWMELIGQKIELETLEMRFIIDCFTERGLNHILKLKNLKTLIFKAIPTCTPIVPRVLPVTDDFLMAVGDNLSLLETLEVFGGHAPNNVTDEGFKSLASLKNLRKLSITHCDGITDKYLVLFSGLEELDLMCCKIYDTGVIELLKKAETLRVLNLDHTHITNDTLEAAGNATMKRTNGISLTLFTANNRTSQRELTETSPLLKILTHGDISSFSMLLDFA